MPAYKLPGAPALPSGSNSMRGASPPGGGWGRGGNPGGGGLPARAALVAGGGGGGGMPSLADARQTVTNQGATPSRGTVVTPPTDNKGYQTGPVAMAKGGPVLGRTKSFMKTPDEFTGGRMPTKQSAPAKQDYGSKGGVAKRTGDKSLSAVKPRG